MKNRTAKLVLLDLFESLANRIHSEEKKEGIPDRKKEPHTHAKHEARRKALETMRDAVTEYRLNLEPES